ncbi:MAG: CBS domain-containing protein [Ruminococcaceae bacterium]|nr:CBS domain-containing protein [Oscillospiraceae bacterium]
MSILKFLNPKVNVTYLYDYNTVRRGIDTIRKSGFTALPVITKDGEYAGTVSEGDMLRCILDGDASDAYGESKRISDILRKGFNPALHANEDMLHMVSQLTDQNFVPVVDDKETFVGIITRKDVMKYFFENYINKG